MLQELVVEDIMEVYFFSDILRSFLNYTISLFSIGGGGVCNGGGGGGSSFSLGFSTVFTSGYRNGDGYVTIELIASPSRQPSSQPSLRPSSQPSSKPTQPSSQPSSKPTSPSSQPTEQPSRQPSSRPTAPPSRQPTSQPSRNPTSQPSHFPRSQPTVQPTCQPTTRPTIRIVPSLKYGLVAYYSFDGNVIDRSGNNNNGIMFGNVRFVTDRFGHAQSACDFDGKTAYILVPGSSSFSFTQQLTVSFYFKQRKSPTFVNIVTSEARKNSSYALGGWGITRIGDYGNAYQLETLPSVGKGHRVGGMWFETNYWQHIAVVKSGSQVIWYSSGVSNQVSTDSSSILTAL
jgi:hypothetical protein